MPSITAPNAQTLPDDILYRIFMEVRDQEDWRTSATPVVAQVCQSWRAAAINARRLWATVLLSKSKDGSLPHHKLMIQRSGNSPLDILITPRPEISIIPHIMNLLLPHVHRWRSFTVNHPSTGAFCKIFDDLRDARAPMLEELIVHKNLDSGWEFQPFGGGAPKLRVLVLGCNQLNIRAPLYNHLARLEIRLTGSNIASHYSTDDIFLILSYAAGTLEELVIEAGKSLRPMPSFLPVVLPRLTRLSLDSGWRYKYSDLVDWSPRRLGAGWARVILSGIRGPAFRDFGDYVHQDILELFAAPSLFPFTGLHALRVRLDPRETSDHSIRLSTFISVLRQLPGLKAFSAWNALHFDPVILAYLLPELETLRVYNDGQCPHMEISKFGAAVQTCRESQGFSKISRIKLKGVGLPEAEIRWLTDNIEAFIYDPSLCGELNYLVDVD